MSRSFCCEEGRADGDFLGGTAAEVGRWLLLEYAGPWGRDAIANNDLPPSVREWLARELARSPGTRLLFIRRSSTSQPGSSAGGAGSLFVVETGETSAGLVEFRFEGPEELVGIDLDLPLPVASERRFLLTCTNALRDRCCAKYGVPVYKRLGSLVPEWAWECTHTGGHRYAASVLSLPEGAYYGFLDEAIAPQLVEAHRGGELLLDHYRGRSFHPQPVQAADVWLRCEDGITELDALHWVSTESVSLSPRVWRIVFDVRGRGRATLEVIESVSPRLTSCSPEKWKDSVGFQVVRSAPDRADIL